MCQKSIDYDNFILLLTRRAKSAKIDAAMEIIWTVVFALLGMAVGSFLNVVIDRLPSAKSLVFPASHCGSCQQRLSAKDLIPVLSYLTLRGRCRYCQAPIPRRLLWVEMGSGALFAYLYWLYGLSPDLAASAFYGCLFLVLMVIDLEHGLILNKIVYPAMVVALAINIFLPDLEVVPGIASGAGGAGLGLGLFLLIVIASRGGMGWGDIKMATLIGLVTGLPLVLVAILLAVVLGGLVAVVLLLLKLRGRKQAIPFGPFLSLGAMVALLHGTSLVDWYLGLF